MYSSRCIPPAAVAVREDCLCACWDTPSGVGLEIPPLRVCPDVGLETPLARPLNFPLGCGPGDPHAQTPHLPLRCGPGQIPLARPLNFPLGVGLETYKACWDTTTLLKTCCKACWDTTCYICGDATTPL